MKKTMKTSKKTPKGHRRMGMATPLNKSAVEPIGANQVYAFEESKYAKARKSNYTKPKRRKK